MPEVADAVPPWRRPPRRIPQPPRTPPPASLLAKRPVPKPPLPKPGWPKRPLPWPKMKVKVEPGVEVKVEPKVEVVEPKPMPKPKKPLPKPLPQRTPKDGHNIKDLVLAVHKDKNPAQLADPGFIDDSLAEYKDHEREVYFAVCEQYQVTPVLRREPGDWDYKAPMLHRIQMTYSPGTTSLFGLRVATSMSPRTMSRAAPLSVKRWTSPTTSTTGTYQGLLQLNGQLSLALRPIA